MTFDVRLPCPEETFAQQEEVSGVVSINLTKSFFCSEQMVTIVERHDVEPSSQVPYVFVVRRRSVSRLPGFGDMIDSRTDLSRDKQS